VKKLLKVPVESKKIMAAHATVTDQTVTDRSR
jgi:hypothetical protein